MTSSDLNKVTVAISGNMTFEKEKTEKMDKTTAPAMTSHKMVWVSRFRKEVAKQHLSIPSFLSHLGIHYRSFNKFLNGHVRHVHIDTLRAIETELGTLLSKDLHLESFCYVPGVTYWPWRCAPSAPWAMSGEDKSELSVKEKEPSSAAPTSQEVKKPEPPQPSAEALLIEEQRKEIERLKADVRGLRERMPPVALQDLHRTMEKIWMHMPQRLQSMVTFELKAVLGRGITGNSLAEVKGYFDRWITDCQTILQTTQDEMDKMLDALIQDGRKLTRISTP